VLEVKTLKNILKIIFGGEATLHCTRCKTEIHNRKELEEHKKTCKGD
jgi:hypothetical protein